MEQNKKLVILCMAPERWNLCPLNKNLCCAICEMMPGCRRDFENGKKGNKIKPCNFEMFEDCENSELLDL